MAKKDLYIGKTGKLRKGVKAPKKPYGEKTDFYAGETAALRKGIDPKRMSAKQRKAHGERVKSFDPNTLTAPLIPRTLDAELKSALRLKYGGEESQLQNQLGVSQAMHPRIDDWFGQYRQAIKDAETRSAQATTDATNTLTAARDTGQATDEANRAKLQQQAQADAQSRGATYSTEGDQRAQQAAAARAGLLNSQIGLIGGQGASSRTLLANREATAAGQQGQEHLSESGRERDVRKALQTLEVGKGDYALQYRAQARQNERQNLATLEALGINKEKNVVAAALADANISDKAADNARQKKAEKQKVKQFAKKHGLDKRKQTYAEQKDAYQRATGTGPYKKAKGSTAKPKRPYTQAQQTGARNQFSAAQSALRKNHGSDRGINQQRAIDGLINSGKAKDPDIALAAVQMQKFGGVGEKTRRILKKRYGLKLKGYPKSGTIDRPTRAG
jgi:hypothetical protein